MREEAEVLEKQQLQHCNTTGHDELSPCSLISSSSSTTMHPLLHYVSTKYRLSVSLELQKGRCVLCRLERPACTKQRPYKNPASQPASRKDFNPSLDRCNLPLDTLSAACMYSLRLALNHLGYPVKDHNTDFSPPPNPPPAHHPHINSLSPPLTYP